MRRLPFVAQPVTEHEQQIFAVGQVGEFVPAAISTTKAVRFPRPYRILTGYASAKPRFFSRASGFGGRPRNA